METVIASGISQRRFATLTVTCFALVALALAALGVYGVTTFLVRHRRHEIGVRIALGAKPSQVQGLLLRQGLSLCTIGVIFGLFASLGLTRFLRTMLVEVSPTDPLSFVVVTLLVIAVATLSCWIPVRRASIADPITTLRSE
jgi:ABC-type antimicrobial peptide transport system permease subunit